MTDVLDRLTPHEDGVLRRLHFFESMGATLALEMRVLKGEIRSRDTRAVIRDPDDRGVVSTIWLP